jgi:hypothetical protein
VRALIPEIMPVFTTYIAKPWAEAARIAAGAQADDRAERP